jgi:ParB-like chromosome segregation protein Spo0J
MCSSIREFGFKIPVLARSNGEVVDGYRKLVIHMSEKSPRTGAF